MRAPAQSIDKDAVADIHREVYDFSILPEAYETIIIQEYTIKAIFAGGLLLVRRGV